MIEAAPGGAVDADGDRWRITGRLTFGDAGSLYAASERLPLPASGVVDLGGLDHADSSALAMMLALKRRAAREGTAIAFVSIPPALGALAHV